MDEAIANPREQITLNSLEPPASTDIFELVVRYDEEAGWIECVPPGVSYRTDRITAYFEILWHSKKPKAVGVKVSMGSPEDIAAMFDELRQRDLNSGRMIPLASIFLLWRMAINPPVSQEDQFLAKFYRIGTEAVGDAVLAPEAWRKPNMARGTPV